MNPKAAKVSAMTGHNDKPSIRSSATKRLFFLVVIAALTFLGSYTRADISLDKVVIALKPDKDPDQMLQERKGVVGVSFKKSWQAG